jgi:hypothetical protein
MTQLPGQEIYVGTSTRDGLAADNSHCPLEIKMIKLIG